MVGCSWEGIGQFCGAEFSKRLACVSVSHAKPSTPHTEEAKESHEDPAINAFRASPRKKGKSGRPRVYDPAELPQKRSLGKLAAALDMPTTSLFKYMTRGNEEDDPIIRPHSSAIKPLLSEMHELARMTFATSCLDCTSGLFDDCLQEVHVDEKWFFLTEAQMRFWLSPEEPNPHRRITKATLSR
jgi:hypothetical protein